MPSSPSYYLAPTYAPYGALPPSSQAALDLHNGEDGAWKDVALTFALRTGLIAGALYYVGGERKGVWKNALIASAAVEAVVLWWGREESDVGWLGQPPSPPPGSGAAGTGMSGDTIPGGSSETGMSRRDFNRLFRGIHRAARRGRPPKDVLHKIRQIRRMMKETSKHLRGPRMQIYYLERALRFINRVGPGKWRRAIKQGKNNPHSKKFPRKIAQAYLGSTLASNPAGMVALKSSRTILRKTILYLKLRYNLHCHGKCPEKPHKCKNTRGSRPKYCRFLAPNDPSWVKKGYKPYTWRTLISTSKWSTTTLLKPKCKRKRPLYMTKKAWRRRRKRWGCKGKGPSGRRLV